MEINRNNPLRTKLHTVLSFEGIDTSSPTCIETFFNYLEGIWKKLGIPISKVGYDERPGSLSFARFQKKIRSLLPTMTSLDVSSLPEGVQYSFEYCFSEALISKEHSSLSIGFESDKVPLRASLWRDLYEFFVKEFKPKFGYLFERPFDHGPYLYTVCVGTNKKFPHERNGRISQWIDALQDNLYLKNGWLREVFPWNFLGPSHLNAPVGKIPLRDWISLEGNRGTLTPITDEMMLWDVPDDKLAEIGKQLMDAGRVFDYMRDIVAHRPPAPAMSMEDAVATVYQGLGIESPEEVEIRKGDNTVISDEEKKRIFKKKPKR